MIPQVQLASYDNPLRVVDAAQFDATDRMVRGSGLSGAADSKSGIFSAWIRNDGNNPNCHFFMITGTGVDIGYDSTAVRKIYCFIDNGISAGYRALTSSITFNSNWIHILASWDVATANAHGLYRNDVLDENSVNFVNATIDYTGTNAAIGASEVGGGLFNGCLADLYFAPGQYLDFSLVANRRKFISASGKPVHLGTDGALPTGTAPIVYQHIDDGEAVANFATNRGTGGNFSITGTLTTASTAPSD